MKKSEILIAIEQTSIADLEGLNVFMLATMGPIVYDDFKKLGRHESFDHFLLISIIACRAENESVQFVQAYKREFGEDLYKKCNEIFMWCCCAFFSIPIDDCELSD